MLKLSRFTVWGLCIFITFVSLLVMALWSFSWWLLVLCLVCGLLSLRGFYDFTQTKHAIRRNYPIIGNLRFILEGIRPELRQYFLEDDLNETPFSRNQRSIVYQRAKGQVDKRPFGTQLNVYGSAYEWMTHSMAPTNIEDSDFRVLIGGPGCTKPYHASIFNISAMSFGALSANAVMALNKGAQMGGFAHDTGEGGISRYHKMHNGDLIWNIGSGYFGCCDGEGRFNDERFVENATREQVKMIEIKLSQGAKPGQGGILPGSKVTPEVAEARGVEPWKDCNSPAAHNAFHTPMELMAFIDKLRRLSGGKPVGIKLCIGHPWEWFAMVKAMLKADVTPDFIVVDGAEGGTGAAPVEFTDHVGTPLQEGLWLVHNTLVGVGLRDRVKIGAAGKVVTSFDIAKVMALGADWTNSARGFLFALGCIQAQTCHTGTCPTGVTTQDPVRQRALVVPDKAQRVYNYHKATMAAVGELIAAAGVNHPQYLTPDHIVRRVNSNTVKTLSMLLGAVEPNAILDGTAPHAIFRAYWGKSSEDTFAMVNAH